MLLQQSRLRDAWCKVFCSYEQRRPTSSASAVRRDALRSNQAVKPDRQLLLEEEGLFHYAAILSIDVILAADAPGEVSLRFSY